MSDIKFWSPVDGSNVDPPPDGFPEGQPAKSLNDSCRAIMGAVRREWEDKDWFDWGHNYSYSDATTIVVSGTHGTVYTENRRVRARGTNTGEIYGRITNVAIATDTTLTLTWDSGNLVPEIDSSEAVALGVDPTGSPVTAESIDGIIRIVPEDGGFEVGDIKWQSHTTLGTNWRECNGQALAKATYPALDTKYAADGYPWGESGSNLLLPNLNGRVQQGRGQGNTAEGGGLGTTYALGDAGGEERHTLTIAEMPSHDHPGVFRYTVVTGADGTSAFPPTQESTQATGLTGGDGDHENRHPFLTLIAVVKVQ